MCGIFFARSLSLKISEENIHHSLKYIKERGPDKTYYYKSKEFNFILVNSVLNITQEEGTIKHPFDEDIPLSYNGEIYGWSQSKQYINHYSDTKTFDHIINNDLEELYLNDKSGFFAFIKLIKEDDYPKDLIFGTDLTSEKNLFYYFDNEHLIISSSPKSIYEYLIINNICKPEVDIFSCQAYLFSRNLIYNPGSFIKNIKLMPSGTIFSYSLHDHTIKDISSHSKLEKLEFIYKNYCETFNDEFHLKEGLNIATSLNKNKIISSTFSGGIDSSVVSYYMVKNNPKKYQNLITLNFDTKDKVSLKSNYLYQLIKDENSEHLEVDVNLDMYEKEAEYCYERLLSPLPTHSYPSFSLICRLLSEIGSKILFVGDGADELFGGYAAYDSIQYKNSDTSISPYSSFNCEADSLFKDIYKNIEIRLSKISSLNEIKTYLDCENEKSTLIASRFLDYELNLRSTGLLCSDLIGSSHGIECRSGLITKKILANFLFGSTKKAINEIKTKKKDLKNIFSKIYGEKYLFPKQGFSGFPNEYALRLFGEDSTPSNTEDLFKMKIGSYKNIKNYREQWKVLNLERFLVSL